MDTAVQPLLELARAFLAGDLGAAAFDVRFRSLFSTLPVVDEQVFGILEDLAVACDAYVDDPGLRDAADDLDEDSLRAAARTALDRLGVT